MKIITKMLDYDTLFEDVNCEVKNLLIFSHFILFYKH